MLYRGDLRLLLSVPALRMSCPMGTLPEPGGWNRMALQVDDLPAVVEALGGDEARLRTGIVTGVGVRHVLLEDPAETSSSSSSRSPGTTSGREAPPGSAFLAR